MQRFIHILFSVMLVSSAEAVILAGGDGAQNASAPDGGQGWDYVGRIDLSDVYSSVTYISNNWFITANHIKVLDSPTGVIFNGSSYAIDPNSWTRLQNSTGGDADLVLFRVVGGTIGLPGLKVRSSAISNGSGLTMIGNGYDREAGQTHWDVDTTATPWTWTEVSPPPPADLAGYKWAAGSTKRWGTNVKEADAANMISIGFGSTDAFYTDFDDNAGDDEAQGARYDSGGGVFYNNSGDWELAGIILAVGAYSGQPAETSVYGNRTYIADMQYYAAQIAGTAAISDIDGDGIPDGWEYRQSSSTTGVVASADQDGDGFTGEEEWIADTDPTDGSSFLRLSAYTDPVEVVFKTSPARQYRIEYRTSLSDTNETWQAEVDWFVPVSTQTVRTVSTASGGRLYRVAARLY